jgi:HicB family
MRRSNFALRLQPSLLEEARKAAESEGVALNQLINVAVAEKVSALRTQEYFSQRARRSDRKETLRILDREGRGNRPIPGDELPSQQQPEQGRKPSRKVSGGAVTGKRLKKKARGS